MIVRGETEGLSKRTVDIRKTSRDKLVEQAVAAKNYDSRRNHLNLGIGSPMQKKQGGPRSVWHYGFPPGDAQSRCLGSSVAVIVVAVASSDQHRTMVL